MLKFLVAAFAIALIVFTIRTVVYDRINSENFGANRTLSALKATSAAIDVYIKACGKAPSSIEDLIMPIPCSAHPSPFLEQVPVDGWGRALVLESFERGQRIVSLGADGNEGGEGEDMDLSLIVGAK